MVLPRGKRLAGRVLDKATGVGVAGVRIAWTVWKETMTNGGSNSTQVMGSREFTTDQTGRFEFTNAPSDQVFLMVHYPLGKQIIGGSKPLYVTPGGEGVVLYLEDAPEPH